MKDISFAKLKENYNTINRGCGTGKFGKIFLPSKRIIKTVQPKERISHIVHLSKKKKIAYGLGQASDVELPIYEKFPAVNIEEFQKDRLIDVLCNNWSCKRCRSILIKKLHENILREIYRNDMKYHLVVTAPGGLYRKNTPYYKSYSIMTKEFEKLMNRIRYELNKLKEGKKTRSNSNLIRHDNDLSECDFAYIVLPRAQAHPEKNNPRGFCHLHLILNLPINKNWIEEKIKKNNYKIGWTFIRENQELADYLCKDFFEDDEFIIPYGHRHYNSSRNVIINIAQGYKLEEGMKFYKTHDLNFIEKELDNQIITYDIYGNSLNVNNSLTLPFEEYVKRFVDAYKLIENNNVNKISLYVIYDRILQG
jgi:hypothetical protein